MSTSTVSRRLMLHMKDVRKFVNQHSSYKSTLLCLPGKCTSSFLSQDLHRKNSVHFDIIHKSFSSSQKCKQEKKSDRDSDPEVLYRAIDLLVLGHEKSVLESYLSFCETAAKELDITVNDTLYPKSIFDRMTLLKSIHVYKKHRVQYESRTHRQVLQLKYLTSSTANVYLEYIERNIPAGVAMHVHKWQLEQFPDHIAKKMKEHSAEMTDADWAREFLQMEKMKISKDTIALDYEEYETTKRHLIGTTM